MLGSKRNLIAFLTGVPHHHLQVLHQGLALIFTYMSVVHSVAAIIRATRDYGFILEFKYNQHYPSGALALAALLVLFVGSMPVLRWVTSTMHETSLRGRRNAYELFWVLHITMAVLFLGALCWHSYSILNAQSVGNLLPRTPLIHAANTIKRSSFSSDSRYVPASA